MIEQLKELVGTGFTFHLILAIFEFLVIILLGSLLRWVLTLFGRRAMKRSGRSNGRILEIATDRIKWLAVVLGAYFGIEEIAKAVDPANATAVQFLKYAQGIVYVSFVAVITVILIRVGNASIRYAIEAHATKTSSLVNEDLIPLLNRVVTVVLILVALIITLNHFGQDVSSLVVSLGVGSLAIALAAQETIANMIAGFVIMMDRPFRVGDRIELASGEIGDVFEIGLRSTKILNFDNNLIVSPNAELIKGKVINYSYPEQVIRVLVEVGVAYGTDIKKARSIMIRLATNHQNVLEMPVPEVFVIDLGDSSVVLRLVARTDDFRKKFVTETALREQIHEAFNAEGVEIPFPQRVVTMKNPPNGRPPAQSSQKRKASRR